MLLAATLPRAATILIMHDPARFVFLGIALACVAYFVVTYALNKWRHMTTMNDFLPILFKRTITISYVYDSIKRAGEWQARRPAGPAGVGDTEHNALVALIAIEALNVVEALKVIEDVSAQ